MNQCFVRTEKLSTFAQIASSAKHTFREIDTPNADPSRTPLNVTTGPSTALALRESVKAALPAKRRKDAVLCIEYLITASPAWFEEVTVQRQTEYFNAAVCWLNDRHESKNVVCRVIHLDETSPHLVAYVIPLTVDHRLCAKDFLGGPAKMSAMQTDFAATVGALFGLVRGLEGARASHSTNKAYNAALLKNPMLVPPQRPTPTLMQRATGQAAELYEKFEEEFTAYSRLVEQARNVTLLSRHANAVSFR